jgi:hypothetical protein
VTPEKVRALRIKLANVLWRQFPKADAISIGLAANAVLKLMLREAVDIATMPHEKDCACWDCVLRLHAEVIRHRAMLQVKQETEKEFD